MYEDKEVLSIHFHQIELTRLNYGFTKPNNLKNANSSDTNQRRK